MGCWKKSEAGTHSHGSKRELSCLLRYYVAVSLADICLFKRLQFKTMWLIHGYNQTASLFGVYLLKSLV